MALSSTLVATGFVSQSPDALGPFLAVVLPTLFVLGLFTLVRLVDTGVEHFSSIRAMGQIRRHYAELAPEARQFFGDHPNAGSSMLATAAAGRCRFVGLFTIASMIAVVNAVVAGTGIASLVEHLSARVNYAFILPIAIGVVVGLALVVTFLIYRDR